MQGKQTIPPQSFKPILWSYDLKKLNAKRNKETVIVHAVNYGTLAHWRWLVRRYGKDAVRDVLSAVPVTALRPRVRKLTSLLFGVERFHHAPRGVRQ